MSSVPYRIVPQLWSVAFGYGEQKNWSFCSVSSSWFAPTSAVNQRFQEFLYLEPSEIYLCIVAHHLIAQFKYKLLNYWQLSVCDWKVWHNGVILSLRSRTSSQEIWFRCGLIRSRLQNSAFLCLLFVVKWGYRYLWYLPCLFGDVPCLTVIFVGGYNITVIETNSSWKSNVILDTVLDCLSSLSRFLECGIYRHFHCCRSSMIIKEVLERWRPLPWYLTMIMAHLSPVCYCSWYVRESIPLLLESHFLYVYIQLKLSTGMR